MTPGTNRAVALYRTLKLKEWDIEQREKDLSFKLHALSLDEFNDYALATQEIDRAMDEVQVVIDKFSYAFSTSKQLMHRAANQAGLDRSQV